ncbi:MAG: HD-GYP domain-containing protein [Anaerovoracaceae bacterium]|jgi:diguanylate cyclase (GGDEF)-like protein
MYFSDRRKINSGIHNKIEYRYKSIKIALIYLTIGMLWIYFSDKLIHRFVLHYEALQIANIYKGWFFILITTTLIYFLISAQFKKLETARAEVFRLSYIDPLTGIYNRRYYEEELKKVDREGNYPISLIIADVDDLKVVNDALGHQVGDELIRKAASTIRLACRSRDIVARWGGDEFVILLPNTTGKEAEKISERIIDSCSKSFVDFIPVSLSIGCSTKTDIQENFIEVLKSAEKKMYQSKSLRSQNYRLKMINAILRALYEKYPTFRTDSIQVSELCEKMVRVLALSDSDRDRLKILCTLYDIGNIAIDINILNKESKLTIDEIKEIQRHTDIGYRILSTSAEMLDIANEVLSHHERWDGEGYPRGLKGEEIPYLSRILAVIISYSAMSGERPYRKPLNREEIVEEFKKNAGTQFESRNRESFYKPCDLIYKKKLKE